MALIKDQVLTANGDVIFDWRSHRGATPNMGTIAAYGSAFGSGTVTVTVSFDGGTTYMALKDIGGTSITFTANGYANFQINGGQNPILTEQIKIKATLAGSTNPTVSVRAYDML